MSNTQGPASKKAMDVEIFNHFRLTKAGKTSGGSGSQSSDFLQFDSIVVPKILRKGRPQDVPEGEGEMKSMWLAGFLDYERQTGIGEDLKDLRDFIKLPGGKLTPAISQHLYRLNVD